MTQIPLPLQGLSPSTAYNPACKQAVSSLQTVTGMLQQRISDILVLSLLGLSRHYTDISPINISRALYQSDISAGLMIRTFISYYVV